MHPGQGALESVLPEFSYAVTDTHVLALMLDFLGLRPSPASMQAFSEAGLETL